MASSGWKFVVVLAMIFMQIVCGSAPAVSLTDRGAGSAAVVTTQNHNGSSKSRMVAGSEADHHVRCGLPCDGIQVEGRRVSDQLHFMTAAAAPHETRIYPISRPPKRLS